VRFKHTVTIERKYDTVLEVVSVGSERNSFDRRYISTMKIDRAMIAIKHLYEVTTKN